METRGRGPWVVTAAGLVTAVGDEPDDLRPDDGPAGSGEPDGSGAEISRPIRDFDPARYLSRKGLRHLSRTSQLACAAAARVAGSLSGVATERIGVVLGSAWASLESVVRFEREAHTAGPRFVDPGLFAETVANVPAGHVSIAFGWSALNATVAAGRVSGAQAIATALELLAEDRAAVVVAGGADELNPHALAVLAAAEGRQAPCGGEAACLLALESAAGATTRGTRAWGTVRAACTHWTDPAASTADDERAGVVRRALAAAGLAAGSIELVIASAGRSRAGVRERQVLRRVFGPSPPPIATVEDTLGVTWGAAVPLGVVLALTSLRAAGARAETAALVVACAGSGHFGIVVVSSAE
jgi:3-oxoacyl-[acyl-carrier-protein] synthase II